MLGASIHTTIKTLFQKGYNKTQISKMLEIDRKTVRKVLIALVQYDEALVRRLIEKVTVYEDKFTVEFKSGLMVDVNE